MLRAEVSPAFPEPPGRRTMTADEKFMRRAIVLARRGAGRTSPNPMVGAVLVADGVVIAEGWHHQVGEPHAEPLALQLAGNRAKRATLYVNLEPCVHYGRTPPCTDAVIQAGLARVVIGAADPDPRVAGKGIEALRKAGIEVNIGAAAGLCEELNSGYIVHRTAGRPEVILKSAISLDGKVAAADGSSRWVTSERARAEGHRLRTRCDAICVGIGTILADDPQLTTRSVKGPNPLRIVMDTNARTPLGANVLNEDAPTVIFTAKPAPHLQKAGAEVIQVAAAESGVSVREVLACLAQRGVLSVLLEGGPTLASSFLAEDLIDRFVFFIAPKLLGGPSGMLSSWHADSIGEARHLEIGSVRRMGSDLMVTAKRGVEV